MANAEPKYQRATDYVKGIGASLDTLQGRDVLLRRFEISERAMRGNETTFVSLVISELDNGEASQEVGEFHAWSKSLAEKLAEIPETALPVIVKFIKVTTGAGFKVWSIE